MEGRTLTRQTMEPYIRRLADKELILRASGNFRYYFAFGKTLIETDEETYKQAWHEYWIHREIMPPQNAIWQMRRKYGGVARKQAIPEQNVFYLDTWNTLNAYATARVEADMDEFVSSNNPEAQESIE